MKIAPVIALCAAGLCAPSAWAESPFNYVAAYFNHSRQSGVADDDGQGWGARAAGHVAETLFVQGEYQSTGYDRASDDGRRLRLGGGFTPAVREDLMVAVTGEFIQADDGRGSETGFGVHGGAVVQLMEQLKAFGEVGYVDVGDADGPEYLIGAMYKVFPHWDVFADYRLTDLGSDFGDQRNGDVQVGVRFDFGAGLLRGGE